MVARLIKKTDKPVGRLLALAIHESEGHAVQLLVLVQQQVAQFGPQALPASPHPGKVARLAVKLLGDSFQRFFGVFEERALRIFIQAAQRFPR
jgi:hypothetical protein